MFYTKPHSLMVKMALCWVAEANSAETQPHDGR